MAAIIRIKRSDVAGNPTTLAAGELAYSSLADNGSNGGDRLYLGTGTETSGNAANHEVIGGKYFVTQINNATNANTASTIVKRDASGGFSAGAITATLAGSTGLPVSTGISGLGTGVATALAVNTGSAGAVVVNGGALGTPSSGTLTNATGLPVSTGISGLGTGVAAFLATPSSANLAAAITDETGTGALYFVGGALGTPSSGTLTNATGLPVSTGISGLGTGVATALAVNTGSAGAVLVNGGVLGTPSSGTLTNATGLPVSTGISGLGTGVATALAVNTGSAGAVLVNGGVLGTPSSGTLTNATGLPVSTGISGLGTGVATFLATPSSANLLAAVTDETGTGALVFATTPSLTTPALSAPTFSTSAGVTAGTNAQGQGALTSDYNVITTATANPSGVTLPVATVGRRVIVVNKGANPINIYPATGGAIDAIAANGFIQIPVAGWIQFNASSATQWYSTNNITVTSTSAVTSFSAGTTGFTPNTPTTGAITLAGTLNVANGGTGLTGGTSGGILYYSAAGTLASSAALAASSLVVGGGAGVAPSTVTTGTGVVTALGVAVGSAGAVLVNGGVLGTPSSGTLTNATGLPVSTGISGLGTGVATFLATPSSANLLSAITDETGTGALVFGTSPAITTSLTTASASFDLINANAATVNFAGAATALTIGATSGTTTVRNNLAVTGNLTINGTTTTVNSTTVTVDDPIFTLGGDTAPGADDNKDRGIEFRWHNGTAAKVGFFGLDDSTGYFTFIPDATNTSEVFSGTQGDIQATNFRGALIGNADTATKLAATKTIAITGDLAYTSGAFDGSANVTGTGTLATVNSNVGTFGSSTSVPTFTVNGKGLITAASATAIPIATTSVQGLASFSSTEFVVTAGVVTHAAIDGGTY